MSVTSKKTFSLAVLDKSDLKVPQRLSLKGAFWKSSLFNDIYLEQDIYRQNPEMWELDGDPAFEEYVNRLLNLFSEWSEDQVKGWTETETINHWIKPVLIALGWVDETKSNSYPYAEETTFTIKEENANQSYRADILISDTVEHMSLFADRKLKATDRLEKAKGRVLIPVEAKYWNRLNKQQAGKLDTKEEKKRSKKGDAANKLGPNGQTLKYMEILELEWGILSDGATWRLFNLDLAPDTETRYLEFNIYNLYKRTNLALSNPNDAFTFREAAKFFYNFFSKKALYPEQKKKELVRKALSDSKTYAKEVEQDLKVRFVEAMDIVCNGLRKANKTLVADEIRTVAESHLFNILFVKSCESRNILPLDSDSYWGLSLSRIINAVSAFNPEDFAKAPKAILSDLDESFDWFTFKKDGTEIFDAIIKLTMMIHKGTNGSGKGFHIDGFMESVFSSKEWKTAKNSKIENLDMVKALFQIGYSKAPKGSKRKYQEIPYQHFTPRQLGSIYESFLEYKLDTAKEDMIYKNKQWQTANLSSEKVKKMKCPKAKKGELFFTPDNKDRKATGSYYTPDYIVEYIVNDTLGPICHKKSSDGILKVKVCDPAMGSGHFLNGALNFLTKKYLAALENEVNDDVTLTPEEAKRIVLDKCLYGVDINPRAVKLTQLSLWLESAHPGKKLEKLTDQLVPGDSLLQENLWGDCLPGKYDAVVANPPYQMFMGEKIYDPKKLEAKFSKAYNQKNDYSSYFLVAVKDWLKKTGRFGFITSRYFLDTQLGVGLRSELNNDLSFTKAINFGNFQVFEANTLTVILEGELKGDSRKKVNVHDLSECLKIDHVKRRLRDSNPNKEIDQIDLLSGKSSILDCKEKVLAKLDEDKFTTLKEIAGIGSGMQTGCNGVFILNPEDVQDLGIESRFTRDLIKNGDVRSYHCYEGNLKKLVFSEGEFPKSSKAYEHLNANKDKLEKRYEYKKGKCGIFELAVPRNLDKFLSLKEKVIFPYMATDNRFALDEKSLFSVVDVNFIYAKSDFYTNKSLAVILNSLPYNLIHKEVGKLKRDGYYEYFSNVLEDYPVPKSLTKSELKSLEGTFSRLTKLYDKLKNRIGYDKKTFDKVEQAHLKFPCYLSGSATGSEGVIINEIRETKIQADKQVCEIMGLDFEWCLNLAGVSLEAAEEAAA